MAIENPLNNIKECVRIAKDKADFVAINNMLAEMKRRIFSDGVASDGTDIGQYQVVPGQHRKRRIAKGLQVSYVDLKFEGALMNSLQVGKVKDRYVMGFTLAKFRLIAQGNEEQRGKEIFAPTAEEVNRAQELRASEFQRQLQICLNARK